MSVHANAQASQHDATLGAERAVLGRLLVAPEMAGDVAPS